MPHTIIGYLLVVHCNEIDRLVQLNIGINVLCTIALATVALLTFLFIIIFYKKWQCLVLFLQNLF